MKTTSETVIALPVERIDLPAWLKMLSDRDYQACSRAHRAAGIFYENGVFGSVNVESVGGHLLIQHYLAEEAAPARIVMRSRRSRVYLMHLVPASVEVIWTLEVERKDAASAFFRCTVEARMSAPLRLLANLVLLPLFLRLHVRGETAPFAADLTRKVAAGRL